MDGIELLAVPALIAASAFLSGSEVALFSLSRFELRALKTSFPDAHRKIKDLLSDPGGLLLTILFTNEIVNVSLSAILAQAVLDRWGEIGPGATEGARSVLGSGAPEWLVQLLLTTVIAAPVVLLFCEVTPKVLGARLNRVIAPRTAAALYWGYRVFFPIRVLSRFLIAMFRKNPTSDRHVEPGELRAMEEDEFLFMVEEGHKEGKVKRTELELVKNLFELDDSRVGEIHTPLSEVVSAPAGKSIREILDYFRGKALPSRIPVLDRSKKQVLGILHTKDLLRAKTDDALALKSVEELMRKPLFVRSGTRLNLLFRRLKENKSRIAIVTNDRDEALGLVTMNDVLYELFEELFPEDLEREASP